MITQKNIALWLDMGLGKTSITLTALNDLKYNRFAINKTLIIAPKKVAQGTWNREKDKWGHLKLLRISKVLGSQINRIRALNTPADIYIINRENVQWLVDHYRNAWPFDTVVIDEASSFKNHQAKRFKALKNVRPKIDRMIELTGTPAPKGYIDLWAQVFLLDQGERLGKTITAYRERYFDHESYGFGYNIKPGAEDAIRDKLQGLCISMKSEDYLELPDAIVDDIPVILEGKGKAAYKEMERKMLLEVDPLTIVDATSAAVLSNKLQQLCNGAIYDEDHGVHEIHNSKLERFLELIEELNGKPAIVFYSFKHDLTRIRKALAKTNLAVRVFKTTQDEDDWNNKKIDVLLAHPASTAYGLNLQDGGNHIIWFGLNWSLELYQQANKRLHRQGQQQKVIIHRLIVEGGRDEDIAAALEAKHVTQKDLLERKYT
jgi:SNF2 family DNA or RNA helicase